MPREATTTVRVRYAETDRMGVVYYANYFVWFEVGRCELLRSLGTSYRELEDAGISLPVIEAHCTYRQSAHYDDELEIQTRGTLVSAIRMRFEYVIARPADRTVIAEGSTVHAALRPDGRPCRLPADIRADFA